MKAEKEERKESIMVENIDAYNRYHYLFNKERIDNNHSPETDIERDRRFA
jgi:hypothetical protein